MSPVFLVSVSNFLTSPALNSAHGVFSNSWSNLGVGNNTFLTDTPTHSFTVRSMSTHPLSMPRLLFICCRFFLNFNIIIIFSSWGGRGEMRQNFFLVDNHFKLPLNFQYSSVRSSKLKFKQNPMELEVIAKFS